MLARTLIGFLPLLGLPLLACACASARGSDDMEHVQAMAREHAQDAPVANAATAPPAQDVVTRTVTYATVDGKPVEGYLAAPLKAGDAPLPAVIMIHEWWGLNDNIRMMARRLAGEGYRVLAVDLYGGSDAGTPEQARNLMMGVAQHPAAATENLESAARYLQEEEHATKVGIVGWCFGGGWSLRGALAMPARIDAAVMYYGQPITDPQELKSLDAPLLGLFGAEDGGIPVAKVHDMEAALHELGKDAHFVIYPGASHAFANPSGKSYQPEAAADAWKRTLAFFAEHLKSDS